MVIHLSRQLPQDLRICLAKAGLPALMTVARLHGKPSERALAGIGESAITCSTLTSIWTHCQAWNRRRSPPPCVAAIRILNGENESCGA